MALSFSFREDQILVEEMAKFPELWQRTHSLYKNGSVKDKIWADIANKVGKPTDQCKKRWRNIHDTYNRKKNRKTASMSNPRAKKWALEEKLAFLKTAEELLGSFSSAFASDTEDEHSLSSIDEKPTPTSTSISTSSPTPMSTSAISQDEGSITKRRKMLPNFRKNLTNTLGEEMSERTILMRNLIDQETEDDVDLFFKSLAKSVKKMNPSLQQRAKVETLNVITKLEAELWDPLQ